MVNLEHKKTHRGRQPRARCQRIWSTYIEQSKSQGAHQPRARSHDSLGQPRASKVPSVLISLEQGPRVLVNKMGDKKNNVVPRMTIVSAGDFFKGTKVHEIKKLL